MVRTTRALSCANSPSCRKVRLIILLGGVDGIHVQLHEPFGPWNGSRRPLLALAEAVFCQCYPWGSLICYTC